MRDPVTDFQYPDEWVRRCHDPAKLEDVEAGLAVLTSSGQVLRRGFTTGTTAAAACAAAVLSLKEEVRSVRLRLPCGLVVNMPAKGSSGRGVAAKFCGDYPSDATGGAKFVAQATPSKETALLPGRGIGRFTRDTPRALKGSAAISPSALGLILQSIKDAAREVGLEGVTVRLEAERGEEIAKRTLNPRVGVEGGISVLGTTGLVEPWDDHLEESNLERIAAADKVVLTTGRQGLRFSRLLFPEHEAVLVGVRMEKALETARGETVLCGLPALILKFIEPTILDGSGSATVDEMLTTSEGKERMEAALTRGKERYPRLRIVLLDRAGAVIGDSAC